MAKTKVLMCGSNLSVKGGMVSVIKNYLEYTEWDDYEIIFVPTHIEAGNLQKCLYFLYAYCKAVILMLLNKCDIVYLHTAERGSFFRKALLGRTAKFLGKKAVMHHHAAQFEDFYEKLSPGKKEFVNETLKKMDLNITLSNHFASKITDISHNAKVKVLYNAVYTNERNPYRMDAKNILFLGEMGRRKGVYDLLDAIQKLDAILPHDIRFCLCGNGEIKEVEEKIAELKIKDRVECLGWIDGEKKKKVIKNTMINVLPSYNEGMPMTILETMAHGIPNISTNISSIPEVIADGKNGILIEPGNIEQLMEAILFLALNPDIRREYSNNAWEYITEEFSISAHIATVKGYIKEVI